MIMEKMILQDKINNFLSHKNITNPFVIECIQEFIENHTLLFGKYISVDELLNRLESNLDKVTFAGKKSINFGEYRGRIKDETDQNEILIYSDESDLDISESNKKFWNIYTESDKKNLIEELNKRKAQIKSTLIHELTHAAYTIKGSYGMGEKHIFATYGKNLFGLDYYSMIDGNSNYVEAIVNYISTRIENIPIEQIKTYKYGTRAIYMLSEKIGEENIIKSAWNSDEALFKSAYEKKIGENYSDFDKYMRKLIVVFNNSDNFSKYAEESNKILGEIEEILDGKEVGNKQTITPTILLKQSEEGKKGKEDVLGTPIRKRLLDNAIRFIKDKFITRIGREDKEKGGR